MNITIASLIGLTLLVVVVLTRSSTDQKFLALGMIAASKIVWVGEL